MDIQENRIAQILADGDVDNEEMQEKSPETVAKYLHYLKKISNCSVNLVARCLMALDLPEGLLSP